MSQMVTRLHLTALFFRKETGKHWMQSSHIMVKRPFLTGLLFFLTLMRLCLHLSIDLFFLRQGKCSHYPKFLLGFITFLFVVEVDYQLVYQGLDYYDSVAHSCDVLSNDVVQNDHDKQSLWMDLKQANNRLTIDGAKLPTINQCLFTSLAGVNHSLTTDWSGCFFVFYLVF